MDIERLISSRSRAIDASGIRRVFDLGAKLTDPINLSIGQPDFAVPEPVRRAACDAIAAGHNGYTVTQGIPALRGRIAEHLRADIGWSIDGVNGSSGDPGLLVTSGTSGALILALAAILEPGDEVIIPDPYFVMYPHAVTLAGASAVRCDTYPDFRMTAERVEPLLTPRTKAILVNSPGNPHGVVLSTTQLAALSTLCRSRGVLLISDEIYDEFTYADAREPAAPGPRCPSPCRAPGAHEHVLLIRGFGKTYGVTGWRLGYAAGPRRLIDEMAKLQQYSFVCAPAPLQHAAVAALDVDMSAQIAAYQRRRDLVIERLAPVAELSVPGGAFYAFPRIPDRLGLTGAAFFERCLERSVLIIPGGEFSSRDTHFRISYATDERSLGRGLDVLAELLAR